MLINPEGLGLNFGQSSSTAILYHMLQRVKAPASLHICAGWPAPWLYSVHSIYLR